MKAFDFEYNNKQLSDFGMVICNFDDLGLNTVSNGSIITFNTTPSLNGSIHRLTSTVYEECLEATIQICKNTCIGDVSEISSTELRELTKWLCRKKFLKFKLLDKEHLDLYYEAIINVNRIEIDGRVYGLELNISTNRPFALKESKTTIIQTRYKYTWEKFNIVDSDKKGKSTGEYITSYNRDFCPDDGIKGNYYYVYVGDEFDNKHSINDTSYEEGHIYPYTEITINEDGDLNIYNAIEDRDTYIANCVAGEVIVMDYPVIQSSISSHNIQNNFNWNFFRIANTYENSRNDLTISLPCEIKLKYSPIVKVGL